MIASHDMPDDIMFVFHSDLQLSLPSESRGSFGSAGRKWALKRIQQACKLNLTVIAQSDYQHNLLWDGAKAMMQASEGFTRLKTLVLSSHFQNKAWQCAHYKEQLFHWEQSFDCKRLLNTCHESFSAQQVP